MRFASRKEQDAYWSALVARCGSCGESGHFSKHCPNPTDKGIRVHSALCYDDDGKVECICGLGEWTRPR